MNRKKKLVLTTATSVAHQAASIICGFVLPRLILEKFGSETNGLVNSITQFLSLITFLELGVGQVVKSALYKPLSDKNKEKISAIYSSANKFFRRIALIFLCYVIGLAALYPLFAHTGFSWVFTATLILAISISSFARYYFGIVDGLLLTADQRGYILYTSQTIAILLNTIVAAALMIFGGNIHMVKLATSIIYLCRPFVVRLYVNKKYSIDRKIEYEGEPITQKWNGIAQHVAAVILEGTDNVVLTVFSTMTNVSIYSVYHLAVNGVKTLFTSMMNGVQSLLGELWAIQDEKRLSEFFSLVEWGIHSLTVMVFSCTGLLMIPFVKIYTLGVHDAEYLQPVFSVLIVAANAFHCLRMPYNMMILAAGHYKQTQSNYIIAAVMNIGISIAVVKFYGLIGVAVGTLIAMLYQTIWMAIYTNKHLIKRGYVVMIKQFLVDIITTLATVFAASAVLIETNTVIDWVINGIISVGISAVVFFAINLIFYRNYLKQTTKLVFKRLKKR